MILDCTKSKRPWLLKSKSRRAGMLPLGIAPARAYDHHGSPPRPDHNSFLISNPAEGTATWLAILHLSMEARPAPLGVGWNRPASKANTLSADFPLLNGGSSLALPRKMEMTAASVPPSLRGTVM
jgi:hypothetical protein